MESPAVLSLALQRLAQQRATKVLLFVDQLEELYTLTEDREARRGFMEAICRAADDPHGPVRVVFTLRDDYLGRVAETAAAREALTHITVLRSPGPDALVQILVKPVVATGYAYEDAALPGEMVEAVRGEPASLPLLQVASESLWEQRDTTRRVLTRAAYEEMGGVEGQLARHADALLEGLSSDQVELARQIFLRLVSSEGTRKIVDRDSLLEGLGTEAGEVLDRMIAGRAILVRKAHGQKDAPGELELVHESLIGSWERLARWIDESRDEVIFLAEAAQAAELWDRRGRREEEAWHGIALQEAVLKARRCAVVPSLVRDFLNAGQRRAARRAGRRRAVVVGVIGALALVALVLTVMVSEARRQRNRAEQRHAAAEMEGARAALERRDMLEAGARLRGALELRDTPMTRAVWWRLREHPLVWRHRLGSFVFRVAVSPDGEQLAAACANNSVYLIDDKTGETRVLRGHTGNVVVVAYSPDGRYLASGGDDKMLRIWNLREGGVKSARAHPGRVSGIDFTPDSKTVVTAGAENVVRLWDPATGKQTGALEGEWAGPWGLSVAPDGKRLALGAGQGVVLVVSLADGKVLQSLSGHEGRLWDVDFGPEGKLLASAGHDHTVRVWDVAAGKALHVLRGHGDDVNSLSFSPDGKLIASGGGDNTVRLWEAATGKQLEVFRGSESRVWGVAFARDGKSVYAGAVDSHVRRFRLGAAAAAREASGHEEGVFRLVFHPSGETVASGGGDNVRLWDVATGEQLRIFKGHTNAVAGVDISPDGKLLATGADDRIVKLWDLATGAELAAFEGHTRTVLGVAFDRTGKLLASSGSYGAIWLHDVEKRTVIGQVGRHTGSATDVRFSHDGALLLSAGYDGAIRVWDLATKTERATLEDHGTAVIGIAFDGEGRRFVSAGLDKTVRLWTLDSLTSEVVARHDAELYWPDFHPHADIVAAPSADGTALLWKLSDRDRPVVLRGHRDEINSVKFGPQGRVVATASDDSTVRLWQTGNGRPLWRAAALLSEGHEVYTHRGWIRLDGSGEGSEAAEPGPQWRRAIEERAREAQESPGAAQLCLRTFDDELELWDRAGDRRLYRELVPGLERVVALPGGACLTLAAGSARLFDGEGDSRELARSVTAVAWAPPTQEVLVATGREVLSFGADGSRQATLDADIDITALNRVHGRLVLGFREGSVEIVRRDRRHQSCEETPASPVVRVAEGPRGTAVVGFANGFLGIWSLDTGARLYSVRLHGPVQHLLLREHRLYAASELGQHVVLDLDVFHQDYCELMREVWREVSVAWTPAGPVVQEPPADHECSL